MLHVARATPEDILEALAIDHITIAIVDEHDATPLRCCVLNVCACVLVLEQRLDGLHHSCKYTANTMH